MSKRHFLIVLDFSVFIIPGLHTDVKCKQIFHFWNALQTKSSSVDRESSSTRVDLAGLGQHLCLTSQQDRIKPARLSHTHTAFGSTPVQQQTRGIAPGHSLSTHTPHTTVCIVRMWEVCRLGVLAGVCASVWALRWWHKVPFDFEIFNRA